MFEKNYYKKKVKIQIEIILLNFEKVILTISTECFCKLFLSENLKRMSFTRKDDAFLPIQSAWKRIKYAF